MSALKDRAREARELAGYVTVPPWARALKLSTAAIYLIEKGSTLDLKAATADGMARLSGLNAEWIRTGKGSKAGPSRVEDRQAPYSPSQSQPVELDLPTLQAAMISVRKAADKLDLEFDAIDAAAAIIYAYREATTLPRFPEKKALREFDDRVLARLREDMANVRERQDTGSSERIDKTPAAKTAQARRRG